MAVLDRGMANKECIALRVNRSVNMGQFGLMIGRHSQDNSAVPYFDNLFWFGDAILEPGDWLYVYTGSGTANRIEADSGEYNIYYLYWGRPTTLFAESTLTPILFRVDAVDVLAPVSNQPQPSLTHNQE